MPAAPRSLEVSQAELEITKSFGEKEWEDNEVGSSESTHVHGESLGFCRNRFRETVQAQLDSQLPLTPPLLNYSDDIFYLQHAHIFYLQQITDFYLARGLLCFFYHKLQN